MPTATQFFTAANTAMRLMRDLEEDAVVTRASSLNATQQLRLADAMALWSDISEFRAFSADDDAARARHTVTWLGTELDKIAYIKRISSPPDMAEVPHLTFSSDTTRIVRYFPDKLPIGIDGFPIEHVLLYLVTNPDPDDFRLFLGRHAQLLKHLHKWIIRVLVPQPFAPAITRFGHAAREELATPLKPNTADELRWFFPERQRRQQHPDESAPIDDKRFRGDCVAFRPPRYRMLHRLWQLMGDLAICNAQSPLLHDALDRGQARVEFVRLSHQYLHLSRIVGAA